jgi:2-keto-myo-inositol isomerase
LIHASGVEADLPREQYLDKHRGLVTRADRFGTLRQIEFLLKRGFRGSVSLEPFAREVQTLAEEQFRDDLQLCVDCLLAGGR